MCYELNMSENTPRVEEDVCQAEGRRVQDADKSDKAARNNFDSYVCSAKQIASVIAITVLCFSLFAAWNYVDSSLLPFDTLAWKNAQSRPKQALRLRNGNKLIGKSRAQVIKLLGKPNSQNNDGIFYELGAGNYLDNLHFSIRFKNDKVVGCRILQH